MSRATLKKLMGTGGAGLDDSMGFDNLYDILKALAEVAGEGVRAFQATIAAATLDAFVADAAGKLRNLRTSVGTTGTAGSTTVQVHKNGVSQGEATTANTEADGTKKNVAVNVDYEAGDLIELVVSAAPTAGADLAASCLGCPVTVE